MVLLQGRMGENVMNRGMSDGSPVTLFFPSQTASFLSDCSFHPLPPGSFAFQLVLPLVAQSCSKYMGLVFPSIPFI